METTVAALRGQQDELCEVLDTLHEGGWQAPSRCAGWTVADVVLHLAQTNEMAIASAEGRFADVAQALTEGLPPATDVDEAAGFMVARDRGAPPAATYERYRRSAKTLCDAFDASDPRARVTWVVGEMSARTLATTRLAETWIHTGDVFHAFGRVPEPTDRVREIAWLAWRTLPYAFSRDGRHLSGAVAFRLTGPDGDSWDFGDNDAPTIVRGDAVELCMVAARRVPAIGTSLEATGPDAEGVLELVRTWA